MGKASHVLHAVFLLVAGASLSAQELALPSAEPAAGSIAAEHSVPPDHGPVPGDWVTPPFPPEHTDAPPFVDYGAVHDTGGWPVALPFGSYPQGPVTDDGVGIYQCLVPPDPSCFCTPPPCYFGTFYVEGVVFDRRSNLERMPLYFDSTGAELFNTGDFDLATEAGFRLGYWASDVCGIDWNIEYFSVRNFQSTATVTNAGGITESFFGTSGAAVTSLTADYESNLDGLELTVRVRQWRRLAPLVGIRFLQVDEHFNSLVDVPGQVGSFSQADNELFGPHLGFQALLWEHPSWRVETTLKGSTLFNEIDIETYATPAGGTPESRRLDHSALTFVGDLRLGLVCPLGPRANFRIGYHALWLDGIALGPNQNNDISFTTNINSVDLSGVLYQGGDIGFDVSW